MLNKTVSNDKDKLGQGIGNHCGCGGSLSGFFTVSSPVLLNYGGGMDNKCLTCPDFTNRQANADLLESAFGQSGIWNYGVCHSTCWQEEDKRTKYNRIWQRNKYRRTHGLAVEV